MINTIARRPKRLWVASIFNIFIALLSLAAIIFIAMDPEMTRTMGLDQFTIWRAIVISGLLFFTSILALLGVRYCHFVMLGVSIIYFGMIITQNVDLLVQTSDQVSSRIQLKLWGNVIRNSIELIFIFWATLSSKTRLYFSHRANVS